MAVLAPRCPPAPLAVTLALLDAASAPKVASRRMRWPGIERVLRLLRGQFRPGDDNPMAERESRVAADAWNWARVCMDGPVPPGHPSTGLAALRRDLVESITAVGTTRLKSLQAAVEAVTAAPHPAAAPLADLISGLDPVEAPPGHVRAGQPACVLVVRREGLRGVREWVAEENLFVDVVTAAEARVAAPWLHAILFGPPERYAASPWVTGAAATATGGWLIAAPPAPMVTVLSWTGHRRLHVDGYAAWRGAPKASVATVAIEDGPDDIDADVDVPEAADGFRPARPPTFHHEHGQTVPAYPLQFSIAGRTVVAYFHDDIGPKPTRATVGEAGVEVTRVPLRRVRLGHHLMFRTSIAGRDALDEATEAWYAARKKQTALPVAIALQADLKAAMQAALDASDTRAVVDRLVAAGLPRDYARGVTSRTLHPEYIAPKYAEDYLRVCRALGLKPPTDAFGALRQLRTARQHAGATLVAAIAQHLDDMPGLPEALREDGGVVLSGSGVDGVVIATVRDIGTEPIPVPAWRLGSALTERGETWQP